ncbi:hypothetical protein V1514DRAFT_326890 [Lipomyces japonicus]|uniref:uncharacterized protein n=1 Tax=Lipomyces japonicus TaxID=56871 RepID=UPI0034D0016D
MSDISKQNGLTLRYIDIGANLTDPMFRGFYHGKQSHDDDFSEVLERAAELGVKQMLVTGSNLAESKHAYEISKAHQHKLYSTVGVHPCHAMDIETSEDPDAYLVELEKMALDGKKSGIVKAFGEIGLDYARLNYAPADIQCKYFIKQLDIAEKLDLPLFLHSRDCAEDFETILFPRLALLKRGGVVHSFTGTIEEMESLVAKGLYIGINGCSLKTEENLEVVKRIPLEKILLETDAPWCEIRPSHASHKFLKNANLKISLPQAVKKEKFVMGNMVRGRCEPCAISQVATVIAAVKQIPIEEICEIAWKNSIALFHFDEVSI